MGSIVATVELLLVHTPPDVESSSSTVVPVQAFMPLGFEVVIALSANVREAQISARKIRVMIFFINRWFFS